MYKNETVLLHKIHISNGSHLSYKYQKGFRCGGGIEENTAL